MLPLLGGLSHTGRLWPFGFRFFSDLVRGSFQLSLTLLLRYRSRVVFTVGSLCLPNSRAISNARYSKILALRCLFSSTGLSPSLVHVFLVDSTNRFVQTQVLQLHISYGSHRRIRFAVFRVRSPLLTESRLISFPPRTKMLQFGGCPLLTELCDLRSQKEVPFGYPGFNASLRLHRAYRGLARPSSAPEPSHSPNGVITANCVGPTFFCVCG